MQEAARRADAVAHAVVMWEEQMEMLEPEPSSPSPAEVTAGAQIALHSSALLKEASMSLSRRIDHLLEYGQ